MAYKVGDVVVFVDESYEYQGPYRPVVGATYVIESISHVRGLLRFREGPACFSRRVVPADLAPLEKVIYGVK